MTQADVIIEPDAGKAMLERRKRLFLMLALVVAVVAAGVALYDRLVASRHVTTDNAYSGADIALVTPLVGGPVSAVMVEDTQRVHQGDVLVRLDDTDARLALAQAEADLDATARKIRSLMATDRDLSAQIEARTAEQNRAAAQLAAAQADLDKASVDLARRQDLAAKGAVSGDVLTVAQNEFSTATANLQSAQAAVALAGANATAAVGAHDANDAMINGVSLESNPDYLAAKARRDQAAVNLQRMVIRAPVSGVVSRRAVQVGQRVEPGAVLMVVVPVEQAYVDANFKEVQLAHVHPGQKAAVYSDLYGSDVVYHGVVAGFSGGTGAAFSLVPAQNATGNWIKVVQRLPVRIVLDSGELAAHPLQVGLSMSVDVDVSH